MSGQPPRRRRYAQLRDIPSFLQNKEAVTRSFPRLTRAVLQITSGPEVSNLFCHVQSFFRLVADRWLNWTRCRHQVDAVLANERTQIRSDPLPGLSVDTLGAFRVEIAATRSESDLDRSG